MHIQLTKLLTLKDCHVNKQTTQDGSNNKLMTTFREHCGSFFRSITGNLITRNINTKPFFHVLAFILRAVKFPVVDLKKTATVLPKRRHQVAIRPVSWSLFIDIHECTWIGTKVGTGHVLPCTAFYFCSSLHACIENYVYVWWISTGIVVHKTTSFWPWQLNFQGWRANVAPEFQGCVGGSDGDASSPALYMCSSWLLALAWKRPY